MPEIGCDIADEAKSLKKIHITHNSKGNFPPSDLPHPFSCAMKML